MNHSLYTALHPNMIVEARKTILGAELNTIEILKRIKQYKEIRKQELAEKRKLRTKLKKLAKLVQQLTRQLPELAEEKKEENRKKKRKTKESSKNEQARPRTCRDKGKARRAKQ